MFDNEKDLLGDGGLDLGSSADFDGFAAFEEDDDLDKIFGSVNGTEEKSENTKKDEPVPAMFK